MASRNTVPLLVGMMLLTGVCNTLLTKYQDKQCVRNCDDPDVTKHRFFEQPTLQTAQMFVGEMGSWLVIGLMALHRQFVAKSSPSAQGYEAVGANDGEEQQPTRADSLRGLRVFMLALPAICDILATTLMNVGLLLVAASIYQMTRGALVLFVGLFSVIFLRRHLKLFQWLALLGVVAGVAVVGLAGAIWPDEKASAAAAGGDGDGEALTEVSAAIIGVLLIAGAQIFTATQFVLEEWLLENSPIQPIQVVGWEGLFGFLITVFIMIVMHLTVGRTESGKNGYFDMTEGWRQMTSNKAIGLTSILIMISIGGFNYFGLAVTRSVSATARSTIDTCRTLFIWMVSLSLGWESFKWLQIVGFGLLVYSTFLFNGIVQPPFKCLHTDEEVEGLLPEEPIEHQ
ncbi:Nucleotide-sugar transporter [Geosmithia morbida]|uniref:Nucleotide-sugar transporter n=1 Tax=Geosmithia morbida TaxID=1094350 RepID=A0A9P4YUF4_9HYPO|nr:Nucleotide-sugar transporter [Geosmithia morbida]KAF4123308.1 Nucleotide-sugar transporter [Geosmithia morbida]